MRPDPPKVLLGVANALLLQLTPEVRTPFGQQMAGLAGMLNIAIAQEFDRIADRLHEENEAVAAILLDAEPLLPPQLAARAQEAAQARHPANLRVSTLQQINDRLRALLIEVHAAIEQLPGQAARHMDERIWAEYALSTDRRHLELPR